MKISSIHRSSGLTKQRIRTKKPATQKPFNKNGILSSFSKIFDKIDENQFLFQIIGISILTVAILISFQSLADFSTTPVSALNSNYEVRMLTNFQANPNPQSFDTNKIEEIQITPPKTETVEAEKPKTYTVKAGDSLYSISKEFNISINDLVALNALDDSSTINTGQVLVITK